MNELSPNLSYIEGTDRIYPNCLLFKAGSYPDKGLEITTAELAAAVSVFSPVHLNLEHASHGAHEVLKGKLGTIRRSWVDAADPSIARGEVSIPVEIDNELAKRGLSMEINPRTKRFVGGALTYTPRVSDAALMSAFVAFAGSRHSAGDAADIQKAHDLMVKQGAVCSAEMAATTPAAMDTAAFAHFARDYDKNPMQSHHDLAVRQGAECGGTPLFSDAKFTTSEQLAAIQHAHDHAKNNGASCDAYQTRNSMYFSGRNPAATDPPPKGEKGPKPMNLWDKFKAALEGADADDTGTPPGKPAGFSSTEAAKDAEIARLKTEALRKDTERIQADAAAFAERMVAEKRAMPTDAEKGAIIAAFTQAAMDDLASPATITFAEGKTGTRVDAVKALYTARVPHNLTSELLQDGMDAEAYTVLLSQQKQKKDGQPVIDAPTVYSAREKQMNGTGGRN